MKHTFHTVSIAIFSWVAAEAENPSFIDGKRERREHESQ